jgi:hypothetical protein
MDFLDRSKYINDEHYNFCNNNDTQLNDLNGSSKLKLKCFIEKSKNDIKCNKIITNFKKNKEDFLLLNPKIIFDYNYEITFTDFDVINGTVADTKKEFKKIEFNNYNDNNNIYVNENNADNMANIQDFINENDIFLKSLTNDEIKTLQYYTYRGDIFLNGYISSSTFDINNNIKHTEDAEKHMFYSKDLRDYLFKIQMLKIFKDSDIRLKIKNKKLENNDFNKDDYIKIFKLYISDLNKIFKKAPILEKELYVYRGIEINYIYNAIIDDKIDSYTNNYFLSTSLFIDKAYKYTKKENRIICRFKINIGTPIIFVEGISLAKGDIEVILPNNTKILLSDKKIKKYLYSNNNKITKDIICPREYSDYDIIDIIDLEIFN